MLTLRLALLVSALAPLLPNSKRSSIVRRHDVADSVYLAAAARIRGLVHIDLSSKPNVGDGEGTLVAAQWVLTAAHVASELKPGHRVTIGSTRHIVDRICAHPDATSDTPHDIALLHLATAVSDQQPIPLYRSSDEVNKIVWVAGYGDNGDGRSGATVADRRVRAATNRIDEANAQWIIFAFDAPGTPRATPLEGISGPGDSGGPAYLEVNGKWFIAGVSSRQDIGPTNGKQGRYGVREMYTRVSSHAEWIDATLAAKECR